MNQKGISMNGAGGTSGGSGQFFLGLIMMCGGFYLLLNGIVVSSSFGLGSRLFGIGGGYGVTGGMIMIPLIIGIGMVFYNAKNYLGWLIGIGSFAALVFGVISSVSMNLRTMSAFELICIVTLAFGGLGLFLKSLRPAPERKPQTR